MTFLNVKEFNYHRNQRAALFTKSRALKRATFFLFKLNKFSVFKMIDYRPLKSGATLFLKGGLHVNNN